MYKCIKSKLTLGHGYSKEVKQEILQLISRYIKWPRLEGLDTVRAAFLNLLDMEDQEFVRSGWLHKEKQILLCHTKKWRNLACYSTQRNASYHGAIKEYINPDWDLGTSMRCFMRYIQDLPLRTAHSQITSRMKTRVGLDMHAFQSLIHKTTIFSLDVIDREWQKAAGTVEATPKSGLTLAKTQLWILTFITEFPPHSPPRCSCTLPQQFALPCQHYLIPIQWRYSFVYRSSSLVTQRSCRRAG